MRKKFLSLILALCMVMSLLPMTAFAAGLDPVPNESDIKVIEAIDGTWNSTAYTVTVTASDNDAKKILDKEGTLTVYTTEGKEEGAPTAVSYTKSSGELSLTFETAPTESTAYLIESDKDSSKEYVKVTAYVAPTATVELKGTAGNITAGTVQIPVTVVVTENNNSLSGTVSVKANATEKVTGQRTAVALTGSNTTYVAAGTDVNLSGTLTAGTWTLAITELKVGDTTFDIADVTAENLEVTVAEQQTEKPALVDNFFDAITSVTYDGTAKTPVPAISEAGTEAGLTDADYDVTYSANTNVGTATAKVTAKETSDFSGSVDLTFTIDKATLTADMLNVTPPTGLKYGDTITITPTLKAPYTGAGTFTVKYYQGDTEKTGKLDAGAYTFKIFAAEGSNFNAIAEASAFTDNAWTFEIAKASIAGVTIASNTAAGEAVADGAVLTATVTPADADVTYQWCENDTEITGANTNTYTLSGTEDNDSYTVKVTGTGDNYEGTKTSNAIVVGSTNLDPSWIQAIDSVTYNGEPQEPVVVVKVDESTTLTKDTDYTVTYSNNTNAGTATVTVIGMGSYSGTATKDFTIGQADANVSNEPVSVAVGAEKTVTVTTDGIVTATSADTNKVTVSVNGQTVTITGVAETDADTPVNVTISAAAGTNYKALASTTVAVTVTAGSSENPGGNNGGGSSGGSTTPTPPPVEPDPNPPSTGEDVTQPVTPDISEGTASATVDKETADKLVSDAVDNKSENVTVKVDVPADADVNEVKADIPASAVADLASKTNAALTVDTPVGNVTIPNKTLAQLGGTSGNVTVTAAVNEDNSVKVEVQANGSTVGALNGGMKVDLPVSQPTAGTVAVLVDAEGNETILPKSAVDGSEVAVLLENGSATIKFVDNAQSFADTDNHWAKNSIAFVSSRNLFQGMENSSFKADVPMNRAMLVTVLHRLESTPAASGGSFDDVPSDSYYATAAAWAAGKGIVTGDDSGFSGDRSVTREEMAVMLYRYVQTINGNKGTLGSYSGMGGANDVSGWASEAMRWAVGSGIIGGDNSGNLNPGSTATRGEVSQMLMNFVKLITK